MRDEIVVDGQRLGVDDGRLRQMRTPAASSGLEHGPRRQVQNPRVAVHGAPAAARRRRARRRLAAAPAARRDRGRSRGWPGRSARGSPAWHSRAARRIANRSSSSLFEITARRASPGRGRTRQLARARAGRACGRGGSRCARKTASSAATAGPRRCDDGVVPAAAALRRRDPLVRDVEPAGEGDLRRRTPASCGGCAGSASRGADARSRYL